MFYSKWTFSLTSLIVILALALVAPSVMAAEFGVSLSVDSGFDISSADGVQVDRLLDLDGTGSLTEGQVQIKIAFDKVVQMGDGTDDTDPEFIAGDFSVYAYNEFGGIVAFATPFVANSLGNC